MKQKLKYTSTLNALTEREEILLEHLTVAIKEFVQKSAKINRTTYKTRDVHATTYSVLEGKFIVDASFKDHHLFPTKIMDSVVRISNAHMKIVKGKGLPAYGFSVKLTHKNKTTANFPLVNFPLFPFNNVSAFIRLFTALNRLYVGNSMQKVYNYIKIAVNAMHIFPGVLHSSFIKNVTQFLKNRNNFILSFTYHSIGVYRFGDHLVKLKVVPYNSEPTAKLSVEEYMKKNGHYIAQLYVQYAYDLNDQPVNKLHKQWVDSPFVLVGKFIFTSEVDKYAEQEHLSFNPFENDEILQPVGRIQQLRNKAYQASLKERKS